MKTTGDVAISSAQRNNEEAFLWFLSYENRPFGAFCGYVSDGTFSDHCANASSMFRTKTGIFPTRMVKFVATRQYDLHFVTTHTQLVVWLYECCYYFIFLVKVFLELHHAWEVLWLRFPAGIYYASTHWYIIMLNIHLSTIATTWKISVCLASIMYLVQTVVANEYILSSLFTEP